MDPKMDLSRYNNYLKISLTNPALFTVFDLRSTMFSKAEVLVKSLDGDIIENDPFYNLIDNPYPHTSKQDFLYKHLWLKGLGSSHVRKIGVSGMNNIDGVIGLYHLLPNNIDWNNIEENQRNFLITKDDLKRFNDQKIKYNFNGQNNIDIPLSELISFYDVTNGLINDGQLLRSPSRIEALKGVLFNVDQNIKSQGLNLIFSSKYLAANKSNVQGTPVSLREDDKKDAETNLYHKDIIATNADLNVQSLAADFRKLMLSDLFADDYFKTCRAYNVPREVGEAWLQSGGTFENQEKGAVRWIQSSIQFEGNDFGNTYTTAFNYREQGKQICLSWENAPIMSAAHKEEEEAYRSFIETLKIQIDSGMITPEEARRERDEYLKNKRR